MWSLAPLLQYLGCNSTYTALNWGDNGQVPHLQACVKICPVTKQTGERSLA